MHVYFLLPIFAVILVVPVFFPVTTPLLDTVATALLLELHITFCLVPVTFKLYLFPTVSLIDVFDNLGTSTVIWQVYFCFPTFAVITAVPLFLATTLPLLLTVATFFLDDVHFTFLELPLTFNCKACPLIKVAFVLFIFAAA